MQRKGRRENEMRIEILFEDNEILVIYKPAGLASQSASASQPDVVSEVRNYLKTAYVGLVHRLDQPVEGIMVLAKTKAAAADLSAQITSGKFGKTYLAVVCDETERNVEWEKPVTLTDYLIKNPLTGKAEVVSGKSNPNPNIKISKAVLHYTIKATCSEQGSEKLKLLEINLETGRFHQIRVQMSHAGMPLLGDVKYGTDTTMHLSEELKIKDVVLCAYRLKFMHPKTGKVIEYEVKPRKSAFSLFEKV